MSRYKYACGTGKLEHRAVYELHHGPIPAGMDIDHINRDKSDNRIENLRLLTRSENSVNSDANRGECMRGVYRYKGRNLNKPFAAAIKKNYKRISLGCYRCETAAHIAYLRARAELFPGVYNV